LHRALTERLSGVEIENIGEHGGVEDDERRVLWRLGAKLNEASPRRSPFTMRGLFAAATSIAARRFANRSLCPGQTSVSSHAICSLSARSSGLRSSPARQTICGADFGIGVASFAAHRKIGVPGIFWLP
jgi:hypothetical protein